MRVTSQAFVQTHGEIINQLTQEPAFRDIFWRGLPGVSNLQGSELAAFAAWTTYTFHAWESFYFQWKADAFEDQIWSGWNQQFLDLVGYPGVQQVWTIRRHQVSAEFRDFVEREVAGKEHKPLYAFDEGTHV